MRTAGTSFVCVLVVALLASGSITAQAAVVDIPASKDNTLYENNSPLSNGAGDYFFAGITQSRKIRRGVIAFDLAGSIPEGSTVNSVTLTLYMSRTTALDETVYVHRLLADWGEGTSDATAEEGGGAAPTTGDATWEHTFYDSDFWTTPGGDFVGTASASQTVGITLGFYSWSSTSLVSDVQGWVDDPSTNFGWILIGRETDRRSAKRFDSRTNPTVAQRPVLTVDYTPAGDPTGACCTGSTCQLVTAIECSGLGGVFSGVGVPCTPNPCVEPHGACCADDGTCSEVDQSVCDAAGGTFHGDATTCAATDCPVILTPYVDALPIPPLATPTVGSPGGTATYDMTIRQTQQTYHTDLPPTTVWGYDDGTAGTLYPGPTFLAGTGNPVTVNWFNDLRENGDGNLRTDHFLPVDTDCIHGAENTAKVVTHLHGGHVEASSDGYPEFTWTPGQGETYFYPNLQHASTIWYHDHALGITRLNVMMGLAGFYVIQDAVELALNLPSGPYDLGLAIQDRKFNADGSLDYPAVWQDHWVGDTIVVNGKVWPYLQVDQGKYRFRLLNGSGSRFYTLSLNPPAGSMDFTVIGTGGGLLEAPVPVSSLTIGPGERYEIVIDFAGIAAGQSVYLENSAPAQFPNGINDIVDVMRFDVVGVPGDTDPLPTTLRTIERLQEADAVKVRDFRLRKGPQDACGRSPWLINDLQWDDITEYPELDTVEIWQFINDSGVTHPMHMHLVFFQILDRDTFTVGGGGEIIPDGNPQPPLPEENGWKDTALVGPGEILRVIARFTDYKGKYPYHCHILEHEDNEMMRQFQTVRCGDAELDPSEDCDDGARVPADGCSANCRDEEFVVLDGTAAGDGDVSVVIAGVTVTVTPSPGDTPADVLAALAAAVNADATLSGMDITALVSNGALVLNAPVEDVLIGDGGLTEILRLDVTPTLLWWSSLGGATGYDVVEGSVAALPSGFDVATEVCLESNAALHQRPLPTDPLAPGEARWFLAREHGGTYDGGGAGQVGSRDAGIGAVCP